MTDNSKPVFISANTLYRISVSSYIFAYLVFLVGWYLRGNYYVPLFLCAPLILMTPLVFGKRRRYFQFIPNILVLYIGWTLAEIFVNSSMHLYGALALLSWLICLISMLLLVRTRFLEDGGHYVSKRKNRQQ